MIALSLRVLYLKWIIYRKYVDIEEISKKLWKSCRKMFHGGFAYSCMKQFVFEIWLEIVYETLCKSINNENKWRILQCKTNWNEKSLENSRDLNSQF